MGGENSRVREVPEQRSQCEGAKSGWITKARVRVVKESKGRIYM